MCNIYIIRELDNADVRSWQDIAFLYSPAIERLNIFGGADKVKLHFLAKVMSKDSTFVPLNCGTSSVRHRLSELAQLYILNNKKKCKNEMILKYVRKLYLPSFNG